MNMLAANHCGWAGFAFLETERRPHIKAAFEPLPLRMAQHSVQHVLRAFKEAIRSEAHADLDLVIALRLHQRKRFVRDASAALVSGVEEMMGSFRSEERGGLRDATTR